MLRLTSVSEGESKTVAVNQAYPYLRVGILGPDKTSAIRQDSVVFKWNDSAQGKFSGNTISVESNIDWKLAVNDSYGSENFTFSEDSGYGDGTIAFSTALNNLDIVPFDGKLSIVPLMPDGTAMTDEDGVDTYNYDIHQNNLRFLLNGKCSDATVTVDELNKTILDGDVLVDSELEWSVKGSTDWVVMSAQSGPVDTSTVHVTADGVNPDRVTRSKDVVLLSSGGAERTIHVVQDPYTLTLASKSLTFENKNDHTRTLVLQSSGPWSVADVPSWLEVEPESGDTTATVTITCPDQNLDLSDLMQNIRFCSGLNKLEDTLRTVQSKFLFEVTPDATLGRIPTFNTSMYDVAVTSSGDWSVSASESWVNLSTTGGSDTQTIQIGAASANPDWRCIGQP